MSNRVKYLVVWLDQSLSGESIVNSIVSKCSARLRFLYRHKNVLNRHSRKLLTTALIQCHFDYGACAWYTGLSKKCKNMLQVAQNKTVRYILNLDSRSHIGQSELNQVGMLNTADRVEQLLLTHMFNVDRGTAPDYLCNMFTKVSMISSHATRNSDINYVMPHTLGCARNNFCYQAVKLWNQLPPVIRRATSKAVFKSKVKSYLQNRAMENEANEFVYY